jgi:hypothetical protein
MLRSQLQFHGINSSVNVTQIDDLVELLTETNDIILERCVQCTLCVVDPDPPHGSASFW